MSKKSIIVIVIVLGLIIVGGWFYFSNYQVPIFTPGSPGETVPEQEEEVPSVHILSDRAEKYYISSGGGYPSFTKELIIDPFFDVQDGEEQYLSIWAQDPAGIAKVTATVKLNEGDKIVEFQLAEGTKEEGRWEGTWIIENVASNPKCKTEYWAVSESGEEKIAPISSWYPIPNQPPEISQFQGPSQGLTNEVLAFSVKVVDPEADQVSIRFKWDDGYSQWSEYQPSGSIFEKKYSSPYVGTYSAQFQAKDSEGAESDWSSQIIVTITAAPVIPPNLPPEITQFQGPSQGLVNEVLTFSVKVVDPEGDQISVRFDWEEGYSQWSEYHPSGSVFEVFYSWPIAKSYSIQGQARDFSGSEGIWCYPTTVDITEGTIPSNLLPEITQLQGPSQGYVGDELTFSATAVDPEAGPVFIRFKMDYISPFDSKPMSQVSSWLGPQSSGSVFEIVHCWSMPIVYHVSAQAKDSLETESNWSESITVTITEIVIPPNFPPEAPQIIVRGPSQILINQALTFSVKVVDPEADQVSIWFGWDNGQYSEFLSDWSDYQPSGSIFELSHSWASSGTFAVQVQAKDSLGNASVWSSPVTIDVSDSIVSVGSGSEIPRTFVLFQNYPNPFNPITEITFGLPEDSHITLAVFNSLGQQITVLIDEQRGAGQYRVIWDGAGFPNGVYFYRLSAKGFVETHKMLLLK